MNQPYTMLSHSPITSKIDNHQVSYSTNTHNYCLDPCNHVARKNNSHKIRYVAGNSNSYLLKKAVTKLISSPTRRPINFAIYIQGNDLHLLGNCNWAFLHCFKHFILLSSKVSILFTLAKHNLWYIFFFLNNNNKTADKPKINLLADI